MSGKPKFKPEITRVKLNPEQAVLSCNCFNGGWQWEGYQFCGQFQPYWCDNAGGRFGGTHLMCNKPAGYNVHVGRTFNSSASSS